MQDPDSTVPLHTRRTALTLLAGTGAGLVLLGGGGRAGAAVAAAKAKKRSTTKVGATPTIKASGGTGAAGAGAAACVLSPELTEGPYWIDGDKVRADITEGTAGVPLALGIRVLDATTCRPLRNAAVDIWHANAVGVYSGYGAQSAGQGGPGGGAPGGPPPSGGVSGGGAPGGPPPGGAAGGPPPGGGGPAGGGPGGHATPSDALRFLRGVQMTDDQGLVQFATIYPGWYNGRAVHIHLKVAVNSRSVHTGQLFFDDALSDKVFTNTAYGNRGKRDVRNADDGIYQQGGAAGLLTLSPKGTGYTTTVTLAVKL